jgi:sterol 22-desaturase
MVISSDAVTARKVFEKCSDELPMVLHPNAEKLLARSNMAFMNGPVHKNLRNQLTPLFTQKALGIYLGIQEKAIRDHMRVWFDEAKRAEAKDGLVMKNRVFELNTDTSMSVFIGPYLNPELREILRGDYRTITNGFLAWPIDLPGTDLNKAVKARASIIHHLTGISARAKERMGRGEDPACLLDFWMEGTVKAIDEAKQKGTPPLTTAVQPPLRTPPASVH